VRVAALNDIHGNLPALEAVLSDPRLEDANAVVVGGDVVDGPFPAETLDALEALGGRVRFLRGNADRLVLEGTDDRHLWCRDQLGDARATRVAAWPQTLSLEVDGLGPVRFCHATPRSDDELVTRITPEDEVAEVLEGTEETVVVCGHTHIQYDRRVARWRLVCAGSVGWPYEGHPGAFWLLLGPDVSHVRTEYDVHQAAELIRKSGYPDPEGAVEPLLEPPDPEAVSSYFEGMRGA
jgi:putative phosphoesterase